MNRAEDDATCVKCGGPVVDLEAPLKMCSKCQKDSEKKAVELIKYRKERTGNVKRIRIKVPFLAGKFKKK
jgi:NMD protein affecting ribosome stability and mRNA decay